jgi:serine phosphatase RsbU (regulator of sigma subunit)
MQPAPVVVPPSQNVQSVIALMNEHRIGAVIVAEPTGRLLGIFTERDLVRHVATAVPGWREYPISDWMTKEPITIAPDRGWEDAVAAMQQNRVRHLPVVEAERVVGIISSRALMARRTEYLDQRIEARTRELKEANDELMARDAEVQHHLKAAGRLQTQLLLPRTPPEWPELSWAVHFAPLDHLGGDYYDIATPTPEHLGFLIADASGHSVAAAMVAIMARFAFSEVAQKTTSPGKVLAFLNQRLQELSGERFVSAFYCVLNRRTRVLTFANAGHPYPLHYEAATGKVKQLRVQGFLLGVMPEEVYREKEVVIAPGDALCFFTDGLFEARNEIGEQFGEDRLTNCMLNHGHLAAKDCLASILSCQSGFCSGVPFTDDLTAAVCRWGSLAVHP